MGFDITPGFNLGITDAYKNLVGTANSFQGSGGNQIKVTSQGTTRPTTTDSNNGSKTTTKNNGQVLDAYTETPPTVVGTGQSSTDAQQAALDRLKIDQGLGSANDALGRIDGNQNTALQNIGNDYTSAYNTLTGQRQIADRDFATGQTQQLQDFQTAQDNNNSGARNLLLGARRILGAQGAGGGSADLYGAPLAASTEGNNANAVAEQTSERNLGALGTSYQDNKDKIQNSFNALDTQRATSENEAKTQFANQRSELLGTIAQLTGQQKIANGGTYQQATAAAQPYIDKLGSILNTIDGLAKRPTGIQSPNVTLSAPDLAQYDLGRFNAPTTAQQDPTLYSPQVRSLLGLDQDQRQQLV